MSFAVDPKPPRFGFCGLVKPRIFLAYDAAGFDGKNWTGIWGRE
jgi:hypothetical protein